MRPVAPTRVPGPVEQLLRDSLIEFKEHGGAVGRYSDHFGSTYRVCAVGAVKECAKNGQKVRDQACNLLKLAVQVLPGIARFTTPGGSPIAGNIIHFNDHFAGQKNLVPIRNVFRRAIALAAERGV